MTEAQIIAQIEQFIIENGNQEITANILRPILISITDQINDKVGGLDQLNTADQSSVVASINSLLDDFPSAGNIVIHPGENNPNNTPPTNFEITDYYWQTAAGATVALWQYNGQSWVTISGTVLKTITEKVIIEDWDNIIVPQVARQDDEVLFIFAHKPMLGGNFQKNTWIFDDSLGQNFLISKQTVDGQTFNYNLGEIGTQNISDIVNASNPFNLDYGQAIVFQVKRNGVDVAYIYFGKETEIGSGQYQTNGGEYWEITEYYPSTNIADFVPNGGNTTDTGQTLRDDIDANEIEITNNSDARHSHLNKPTLDNFGENINGLPTYNGVKVDTTIAQRDVFDGLNSTDNTISLAASRGKELKDVQDTQQTAINLNTAKVGNVAHPLVEKAVPSNAVFTDTIYDDSDVVKTVNSIAPDANGDVTIGSSLLSEPFTYTGGAQTFTAEFDIVQVDSLLVENTPLQKTQYDPPVGKEFTITDTLTVGAVIELNYWKENAVNATNYTKAESNSKFADKLDKTAEIQSFMSLTQAAYDAITNKSATTIYFIE